MGKPASKGQEEKIKSLFKISFSSFFFYYWFNYRLDLRNYFRLFDYAAFSLKIELSLFQNLSAITALFATKDRTTFLKFQEFTHSV